MPSDLVGDSELAQLVDSLRKHGIESVELAIVLGSGLAGFAERLVRSRRVEFAALDGMPRSSVAGHAGEIVVGEIGGVRVLVQVGRVHLYEGLSPRVVVRSVRAFREIGARGLVLTNAAGSLRERWNQGTLVRVVDHVNLQGRAPLARRTSGFGNPYDTRFGDALERGALDAGIELERGVYAALLGPSYESPAEVRWLSRIGADIVGMSTASEALAGWAAEMSVACLSFVANPAAGIQARSLAHEDVLDAGRLHASRIASVLESSVRHLAECV